jgi:CHASE3 domain sensor protein
MDMKFENLLGLIAKESDQKEFVRLGQEYVKAHQDTREASDSAGARTAETEREDILDQITKQIQWHFRAVRHPIPTRQELEEMLKEHFK